MFDVLAYTPLIEPEEVEEFCATNFHRSIVERLADDSLNWPKPEKISFSYRMVTLKSVEMDEEQIPDSMEGISRLEWKLTPTDDPLNFCDFLPTFVQETDRGRFFERDLGDEQQRADYAPLHWEWADGKQQ